MSLTCLSHTKNCTMENALLWGMCRSHFYQVQIQSQISSRIVHLVLAILEAIPIIGQIVSLIEFKIIQSCRRPEPTSCIPPIANVAFQELSTDIRRIWPTDLKLLGITETQMKEVDIHIRDAFRAYNKIGGEFSFDKKNIKYKEGNHFVDAALPITLSIFNGNDLKKNAESADFRVLLLSKIVFASGGERKICWVYDLTLGTFLLKKRITGLFEEELLKDLLPKRAERGIQTSVIWRTTLDKKNKTDKQNKTKTQIIEPVRDGTLATLFGTAPLSNFSVKYGLIIDLLSDLKSLHEENLSGVSVRSSNRFGPEEAVSKEFSYAAFHSDIKPSNILVFFQNGKWRAELCDFGAGAAHPTAFTISLGFTPPEYIRFYKDKKPFGIQKDWFNDNYEVAQFNIKYGRGRDVWSMGLVILSLLLEREVEATWENVTKSYKNKLNISPLPCLKAILSGRLRGEYDEEGILDLKQETIDSDLEQLESEVVPKYPEQRTELARIFEMLKLMLRIDPNERKSTAQCLAFLQPEP